MTEWLKLPAYALRSLFKSRARLEAEDLVLRQQIDILVRPKASVCRIRRLKDRGDLPGQRHRMKSVSLWHFAAALVVLVATITGGAYAQDAPGKETKPPFSKLRVQPAALAFKKLNLSKTPAPGTGTFVVANKGTEALSVNVGTSTGNDAFVIAAGCGQISLQPGAQVTVTVEFEPASSGKFTGSIAITSNATKGKDSATVSLKGSAKGTLPTGTKQPSIQACGSPGPSAPTPAAAAGSPVGAMALAITGAFAPPTFSVSVPSAFPTPSSTSASARSGNSLGNSTMVERLKSRAGNLIAHAGNRTGTGSASAASPSGYISAYAPFGSWTEDHTGVALIPIAGSGITGGSIATPDAVNSCAEVPSGTFVSGGGSPEAICVANGTDIYLIDGTTLLQTLSSAAGANQIAFSGGQCSTCGVVVDAVSGNALISEATTDGFGGYQVLNLAARTLSSVIGLGPNDGIAEHFAIMPLSAGLFLALSPTEDVEGPIGPDYNIITIFPPAPGNSLGDAIYQFSGSAELAANDVNGFPGGELEDTASLDSTGIAYALDENTGDLFLADLTQATIDTATASPYTRLTWNAPSQVQNLDELSQADVCGMAVAYGTHEALVEQEFFGDLIGAIKLPSTSGSGTPAASDWVGATMPNDPSGNIWQNPTDPHGLTAAFAAYAVTGTGITSGTPHGFSLLMNDARTYVAVIDLDALLAAPREATSGTGSHTIDPSFDLVANHVLSFVPFPSAP